MKKTKTLNPKLLFEPSPPQKKEKNPAFFEKNPFLHYFMIAVKTGSIFCE
jgi:hypothetical protein